MPRAKSDGLTPIRRQYLELKRQVPDAILFFRLGDFYETFDEDAELVSRELDIVLTSRNVAKGVRVPMAGIPYHALESYLGRLIEKGYKVAIAEQIGEPTGRGPMQRKIVRIVTPGTVVEPELLPADANNYLVAVVTEGRKAGIAYADISTGEFAATELEGPDIDALVRAELLRLKPAEVLHPEGQTLPEGVPGHPSPWPEWRFEPGRAAQALKDHFQVARLEGFGLGGKPLAVRAAGAILQYLQETRPEAVQLLTSLRTYSLQDYMVLDATTRRALELTETIRDGSVRGSLLWVLDRTVTPMGKRLLRQWIHRPLVDAERIRLRLDGVDFFVQNPMLRARVRERLKPLADLERLTNRVVAGTAQPRDLVSLRATLRQLPALMALFEGCAPSAVRRPQAAVGESQSTDSGPRTAHSAQPTNDQRRTANGQRPTALAPLLHRLDPVPEALDLLERAIAEEPPATTQHTGIIRRGFSPELDRIYEESEHARQWIASLEERERRRTGIKNLKVGYNKVFGYYIEVTKANLHLVPKDYIRKQTLVNAERFITPEMKEYEALVLHAEERIKDLEARLYKEVLDRLAGYRERLLGTARALAVLDVLAGLAEVAEENDYVRPEIVEDDRVLEIREGRHPVVEKMLDTPFIPNDTVFEEGERIRIITGPNMSGKSTYIRQTALIVLMAQMGSFVPAREARIGLVDRIFTRIGAQDEIHMGQSTFMVEMVETAHILHHATPRSLVILDEIGRGTSTYDGMAIAWAVVEYLHNHPNLRCRTLFATHYHELTRLADLLPGVRNYHVSVTEHEGQVVFLYKVLPGGADRSYGIHVAQLAGLPRSVIARAQEILEHLEQEGGQPESRGPAFQTPVQLTLFPETYPLLEELQRLDPDNMTPLEALTLLYKWRRQYGASQDEK